MGKLTERLTTEHSRIQRVLAVLVRQLDALSDGHSPDYPLMRDLVEYLERYVDPRHHGLEDQLIRAMKELALSTGESSRVLMSDHRNLAELGEATLIALDDLIGGVVTTRESLLRPACDYLALYDAHLGRERNLLLRPLPVLEEQLEERLCARVDKASLEIVGSTERFEELEHFIERLAGDVKPDGAGKLRCRACNMG